MQMELYESSDLCGAQFEDQDIHGDGRMHLNVSEWVRNVSNCPASDHNRVAAIDQTDIFNLTPKLLNAATRVPVPRADRKRTARFIASVRMRMEPNAYQCD
jgi:hypothetical protein